MKSYQECLDEDSYINPQNSCLNYIIVVVSAFFFIITRNYSLQIFDAHL